MRCGYLIGKKVIDEAFPFIMPYYSYRRSKKTLRITEKDFMLANRRAARLEDIAQHGKPTAFRAARHASKKTYSRKKFKKDTLGGEE